MIFKIKEKITKKSCEKYLNISEEKQERKRRYGRQ